VLIALKFSIIFCIEILNLIIIYQKYIYIKLPYYLFILLLNHSIFHSPSFSLDEELDGKQLELLARSPDTLALLNRLGVNRIKDILKFQRLLGVLRPGSYSAQYHPRTSYISLESSQHSKETKLHTTVTPSPSTTNASSRAVSPPTEMQPHPASFHSLAFMSEAMNEKSISNLQ